ncbi:MAG: hypothetical protein II499_10590 [Firmicutes bacterium]|nr:hypothetical protein [Bacillota bacterium]MBQ2456521.1 hypothetical protein [Bacillota bacterium]MBQ4233825.1 hypothetical protein [Bacillota bacterium]MBQ5437543.1 hypothetical protein [Bacillota bacterium]
MKLWLDDIRYAPSGYTAAGSVDDAKLLIIECERRAEKIEVLDLDYDLGENSHLGGTGLDLLKWLAERGTFYPVEVHSSHPYGVRDMESFIDWNWPF